MAKIKSLVSRIVNYDVVAFFFLDNPPLGFYF
jgi:hypothetical protein